MKHPRPILAFLCLTLPVLVAAGSIALRHRLRTSQAVSDAHYHASAGAYMVAHGVKRVSASFQP